MTVTISKNVNLALHLKKCAMRFTGTVKHCKINEITKQNTGSGHRTKLSTVTRTLKSSNVALTNRDYLTPNDNNATIQISVRTKFQM